MRPANQPYRPDAPTVPELASGAVIVLAGERPLRLLLLHLANEDRWCLPKGHVEAGESLREAARREVAEETGLSSFDLGEELAQNSYRFYAPRQGTNVLKTNVFFLGTAPDRSVRLEPLFDRADWVTVERALELVPYEADRAVLRAVRGRVDPPPR